MNEYLLDKLFCAPIESEDAKCHSDLGDGRMSYTSNGYKVFERNGQWYFNPERDENGNYKGTIEWDRFLLLQSIFGVGLIPMALLPQQETEV
jgi:hypothetical protein